MPGITKRALDYETPSSRLKYRLEYVVNFLNDSDAHHHSTLVGRRRITDLLRTMQLGSDPIELEHMEKEGVYGEDILAEIKRRLAQYPSRWVLDPGDFLSSDGRRYEWTAAFILSEM